MSNKSTILHRNSNQVFFFGVGGSVHKLRIVTEIFPIFIAIIILIGIPTWKSEKKNPNQKM
jgi:hypothetical protein